MSTTKKNDLIFVIFLIVFWILLYNELLFRMPTGIHEWGQGERLALAYGFYENGMNFFKPSTLSQFSIDGITGVEFPIQSYIAAIGGKLLGKQYLSIVFRLLNTIVIGICLFTLYKIAYSFSKNFFISILPPFILLLSPCFLDYTCNYIPDAFATSILLVGMGFYLQTWILYVKNRHFWALFLCAFATLIKTSCGIYLIGFVLYDLYLLFKSNEIKKHITYFVYIFMCFAILIGYFIYNRHLNAIYNSTLFLLDIRPISKKDALYFLFSRLPKTWAREYFILPAYILLLILSLPLYFRKINRHLSMMLPFHLLLFVGILVVSYLMGGQFIDHDYYIIPILFPFLVLQAFWLNIVIKDKPFFTSLKFKTLSTATFVVLILFSFVKTKERLGPKYRDFSNYYNTDWMKDGAKEIKKYSIPSDEYICVLNENPPNLSLVYFDRKGYALNRDLWGEKFESAYSFFKEKKLVYGIVKYSEFKRIAEVDNTFNTYFHSFHTDSNMVLFKIK